MTDAVQDTFRSLLNERGGIQNFDETQKVIALRLAEMLVSDATVNASAVVALTGLLPVKPAADAGKWDLTLLTDEQFAQFEKLYAICSGEKPPTPQKAHRFPKRSPRERLGEELALLCDALEADQDAARKLDWRRPWSPTDDDVLQVQNCISSMIGLVVTWPRVAEPWISEAIHPLRRQITDLELAAARIETPVAPPVPSPAPNVVPVRFGAVRERGNSPGWVGDRPL